MSYAAAERALSFGCNTDALIGVLHPGDAQALVGVLLVVGGPQYRVGSHRQFVLLARRLAQAGIPVLRFDYRGMGDSVGLPRSFAAVDDDIRCAVDVLCEQTPSVQKVMLWGLCDAASAALFYAHTDPRVAGLVLLNPWVRTEAGRARAYLKHYYLRRMFSGEFWKKILSGQWRVRASLTSLIELASKLRKAPRPSEISASQNAPGPPALPSNPAPPLPDAMLAGWERFNGKVLLILSGNNDYVADEFRDLVSASRRWRKVLQRASTTRRDFDPANHTFSRSAWRDQVADWTLAWINNSAQ